MDGRGRGVGEGGEQRRGGDGNRKKRVYVRVHERFTGWDPTGQMRGGPKQKSIHIQCRISGWEEKGGRGRGKGKLRGA